MCPFMPTRPSLKQSNSISPCVSGRMGTSLCMMAEWPPSNAELGPRGVPVAGVWGIHLPGWELQDLLGGTASGVWIGLDVKQLRREAEVGVLGGRGDVDLELGWGREGLHLLRSLRARAGEGQASPSLGFRCPLVALSLTC